MLDYDLIHIMEKLKLLFQIFWNLILEAPTRVGIEKSTTFHNRVFCTQNCFQRVHEKIILSDRIIANKHIISFGLITIIMDICKPCRVVG